MVMSIKQATARAAGLFVAMAVATAAQNAHAALIKSYDFDGSLADTLGNGADLVASGGTVSGGR